MARMLVICVFLVFGEFANAGDLEWGGLFRFEANSIDNAQLKTGTKRKKEYATTHLILKPKIVAADGIYINGKIHFLNSKAGGSQLGTLWGDGVGADTYLNVSNVDQDDSQMQKIRTSELYLTWQQEFGALLVGRVPLQFGLGTNYNSGNGFFDHFSETRDAVGYKVVMGNFFILPMLTKVEEGEVGSYDDVSETIVHLQYDNFETDISMGFMYRNRNSGFSGNDGGTGTGAAFDGYTKTGDYNIKDMSIFYRRKWENDSVGFEISNRTGDYGVANAGKAVSASGYNAAIEYAHKSEKSKWSYDVKLGWASGDDPTTAAEYEGYAMDRNYDLGHLLFNHSLGQENLLRTQMLGTRYNVGSQNSPVTDVDIDGISNAYYLAPSANYQWRDQWYLKTTLVTGWLEQTEFGANDADQSLGYELDLSLVFKPNERLVWENTFAYMMAGSAFEVDGQYGVSDGYGLFSRAAISF